MKCFPVQLVPIVPCLLHVVPTYHPLELFKKRMNT